MHNVLLYKKMKREEILISFPSFLFPLKGNFRILWGHMPSTLVPPLRGEALCP
jgi:hypothetical protein